MIESSGVICCFCNSSILLTSLDPCDLTIKISGENEKEKQQDQFFWCHIACFNRVLHPGVQIHFVLPFLGDEEDA